MTAPVGKARQHSRVWMVGERGRCNREFMQSQGIRLSGSCASGERGAPIFPVLSRQ